MLSRNYVHSLISVPLSTTDLPWDFEQDAGVEERMGQSEFDRVGSQRGQSDYLRRSEDYDDQGAHAFVYFSFRLNSRVEVWTEPVQLPWTFLSTVRQVDFVNAERLAGVMVWSIDTDDFLADCAEVHEGLSDPLMGIDYPLMRSINIALARAADHEDNYYLQSNDIGTQSAGDTTCRSWSIPSLIVGISVMAAEIFLRDRYV